MGVNYTQKSVIEIMNEILSAVRDYYDSDYAYYAERSEDEILTVYEWCADGKEWGFWQQSEYTGAAAVWNCFIRRHLLWGRSLQ